MTLINMGHEDNGNDLGTGFLTSNLNLILIKVIHYTTVVPNCQRV